MECKSIFPKSETVTPPPPHPKKNTYTYYIYYVTITCRCKKKVIIFKWFIFANLVVRVGFKLWVRG